MRTRALIVAAMALLCFGVTPVAQNPAPEAADTLIERDYWLGQLLDQYAMREAVGSEPELCFFEDGTVGPVFRYAVANRYFRFADAVVLDDMMESIVGGKPRNWRVEQTWGAHVRVAATEAGHADLKRAIEYWEELLGARLRVELYQLDSVPERLIVAQVPEGAKLIGRRDIPHGGFAVFSQLTKGRTTWMIENYYVGATPTTSDTYHGNQWAAGALLMPDGEIRVQAWLSQVRKLEGREKDTSLGLLELPAAAWDVTSASATVPNGHGVVLQGEQHSYLIRVHTKAQLPQVSLADGRVRLWNAAGCLPHGPLTGAWMLGPITEGGDPPLYLPLREATRRLNFEGPLSSDAAESFEKMLDGSFKEVRLLRQGPLVISVEEPVDPADVESAKVARDDFYALADTALTLPAAHELSAILVTVPKGAELPKGVIDGIASDADLQALLALKDNQIHFQRRWLMVEGQACDVAALHLQNYVSQLHWKSEDERISHAHLLPGTLAQGVQLRVTLGRKGSIQALAAWRHAGSIREFPGEDAENGEVLEAPEATESSFAMQETTEDGQYACLVQPVGDDTRVVLLISRRRAR